MQTIMRKFTRAPERTISVQIANKAIRLIDNASGGHARPKVTRAQSKVCIAGCLVSAHFLDGHYYYYGARPYRGVQSLIIYGVARVWASQVQLKLQT